MARIGLSDRKPVATGDRVEQRREVETVQDPERRPLRLVGADRGAVAGAAQGRQSFGHPGIGSRQPRRIRLVELEEAWQRRRVVVVGCTARGEGAGDQRRRAVADHPPHLLRRQRRPTALAQHFVECRPEVRRAVDESAVEVEDQQNIRHRLMTVRCAAPGRKPCRIFGGNALHPAVANCALLCYTLQQMLC